MSRRPTLEAMIAAGRAEVRGGADTYAVGVELALLLDVSARQAVDWLEETAKPAGWEPVEPDGFVLRPPPHLSALFGKDHGDRT